MLTPTRSRSRARRGLAALVTTAIAGLVVAACSGGTSSAGMSGMDHAAPAAAAAPGHDGMPDMADSPAGTGVSAEAFGFRFAPAVSALPAGQPAALEFRILGADGKPVTAFELDQTKLMHFYLIRTDFTGFQHVHPTMNADGIWRATLAPVQPGSYRAYTSFITKEASGQTVPLVLSQPITVPGATTAMPLPPPSTTVQVDGYALTLSGDQVMAGTAQALTVTVSRRGQPVTDLQPYLDTYAHLTAFHEGDLAFAHLHPDGTITGNRGGPTLSFQATLPEAGNWRLFIQFQTAGVLHTAAVTLSVG